MRKSLLRMPCPQDAPGVDVEGRTASVRSKRSKRTACGCSAKMRAGAASSCHRANCLMCRVGRENRRTIQRCIRGSAK